MKKFLILLCSLTLTSCASTQRTVQVAQGYDVGNYRVTGYNIVNENESHPITFVSSVSDEEQRRVEEALKIMLPVALPKTTGTPVHLEIGLRNVNLSTSAAQSLFTGDTASIQSRIRLYDTKDRKKVIGTSLVSAFGQGRAGIVGAASSADVSAEEEFDALMAKYVTTLVYTLYPNMK